MLSCTPEMKNKSEFLSLSSKTIKHVCLPSAPSFQSPEAYEKTGYNNGVLACWKQHQQSSKDKAATFWTTDEGGKAACFSPIGLNNWHVFTWLKMDRNISHEDIFMATLQQQRWCFLHVLRSCLILSNLLWPGSEIVSLNPGISTEFKMQFSWLFWCMLKLNFNLPKQSLSQQKTF